MYVFFTQLDYIGSQLQQARLGEEEEGETLHLSRWTVEISTTKNGETGRQRYVETFKYVKRVVYKVLQYDVFARKCFKLLVSGVTVWSDSLGDLSICQLFAQFWSSSELYQHDLILSSPLPMHCNTVHTVLWHSAGNLVFQTRTIQKIHNEFQIFYSLSTLPSVDNSKAAYVQHNISTFSTTFLLCQHSNE